MSFRIRHPRALRPILPRMDVPRLLIMLSTLAFLGGVALAMVALRAGKWQESRWHLLPILLGFAFQSAFLYLRGQQHGRCPLTNLFEVFIFIGWCIVLLYFLVGSTYRLSLLGVFTAPLIAFLQTASLIRAGTWDVTPVFNGPVTMAGELHKRGRGLRGARGHHRVGAFPDSTAAARFLPQPRPPRTPCRGLAARPSP